MFIHTTESFESVLTRSTEHCYGSTEQELTTASFKFGLGLFVEIIILPGKDCNFLIYEINFSGLLPFQHIKLLLKFSVLLLLLLKLPFFAQLITGIYEEFIKHPRLLR